MKKTSNSEYLTDQQKQKQPLPGEISPKEAFAKAREFAVKEKANLKK
tara:strand:- start:606 stop:746 length:141 start_codon:yes stop_codon:yes gene_type:complete